MLTVNSADDVTMMPSASIDGSLAPLRTDDYGPLGYLRLSEDDLALFSELDHTGEFVFDDPSQAIKGAGGIVRRGKWNYTPASANDDDHTPTEITVAVKVIRGFTTNPNIALRLCRELSTWLDLLRVDSFVELLDVRLSRLSGTIFYVMPFVPYTVRSLSRDDSIVLTEQAVRSIVAQVLLGIRFMHKRSILHRDLWSANILVDVVRGTSEAATTRADETSGNTDGRVEFRVSICDFGMSRMTCPSEKFMTRGVVAQWYRAPELLLDVGYGPASDMWSLGAVFGELLRRDVLFAAAVGDQYAQTEQLLTILGPMPLSLFEPGKAFASSSKRASVIQHLNQQLASPSSILREYVSSASVSSPPSLKGVSKEAFDLLEQMLQFDPDQRCTAEGALTHPWFHPRRGDKGQNGPDPITVYIQEQLAAQDRELITLNSRQAALDVATLSVNTPLKELDANIDRLVKELSQQVQTMREAVS